MKVEEVFETTEAANEMETLEGEAGREISTVVPAMTTVEDEREVSTLTPYMARDSLSVLSVETRESSEKTNNSLPVFTGSFSPRAPPHNSTENIINYNEDEVDITMFVVEEEKGEMVTDMMFIFDCVKAYNAEMSITETQAVLQCKMFDKEDGENIFIVVEKNLLSP